MNSPKQLILLDMDNTIVDYDSRFHELVAPILSPEALQAWDKTNYWIEDSFPEEYHDPIHEILCSEGFFLHMNPKDGAIEAIKELLDDGFEVRICTSPHSKSLYCIDEKKKWVEQYLGQRFVDEMIFAHDKTEVEGHLLIDDRDDIIARGKHKPSWQQVLFDATYNQNSTMPHRLNHWGEWRDVIYPILKNQ